MRMRVGRCIGSLRSVSLHVVAVTAAACVLCLAACSTPAPRASSQLSGSEAQGPASSRISEAATAATGPPTGAALTAQLNDTFRTMYDFSGAVLITRGDQVLLAHAYGDADQKHRASVTLATRFRIGSLTKQFTAMAILILEHQGRLRVGDRVCRYFARCPTSWAQITIAELLTHSSGIPEFTNVPAFPLLALHPSTPEHTLGLVRKLPLSFTPGTAFEYSNSGYVLLGIVVENVSGIRYEDFLSRNIFDPLRMRNTGYDHGHQGVAVGYSSGSTLDDPIDMSVPFSAGALYSTVGDLHLWERSLATGSLVPKAVVAEMEQPRVEVGHSPAAQYGYGVFVDQIGDASNPMLRISHGGEINGFVSWMSHYPQSGLDFVILSNHIDAVLNGLDDKVRQLVLGS